MDTLTFLSSVIGSLAWPATIVVLVFALRNQLPDIVRSLKSIEYKDFKMTFERKVKEVAADVKEALPAWEAATQPGFQLGGLNHEHTTAVSQFSR